VPRRGEVVVVRVAAAWRIAADRVVVGGGELRGVWLFWISFDEDEDDKAIFVVVRLCEITNGVLLIQL